MGMLLLSRKVEEQITMRVAPSLIEQTVALKVVDVRGEKVRFGITAPRTVGVWRDELLRAKSGDESEPHESAARALDIITRLARAETLYDYDGLRGDANRFMADLRAAAAAATQPTEAAHATA